MDDRIPEFDSPLYCRTVNCIGRAADSSDEIISKFISITRKCHESLRIFFAVQIVVVVAQPFAQTNIRHHPFPRFRLFFEDYQSVCCKKHLYQICVLSKKHPIIATIKFSARTDVLIARVIAYTSSRGRFIFEIFHSTLSVHFLQIPPHDGHPCLWL